MRIQAMSTETALLTAEEYAKRSDLSPPTELVRGVVIEMTSPGTRHGQICSRTDRIVGNFADEHGLGHALCNDAGVITERNPDTVRGPDVWFVSYDKVPHGPMPPGYLDVPPDVVFEIKSPSESWSELLQKTAEYLAAGVVVVCVIDPDTNTIQVYREDRPFQTLKGEDELILPEQLPGFHIPVFQFFE